MGASGRRAAGGPVGHGAAHGVVDGVEPAVDARGRTCRAEPAPERPCARKDGQHARARRGGEGSVHEDELELVLEQEPELCQLHAEDGGRRAGAVEAEKRLCRLRRHGGQGWRCAGGLFSGSLGF